MTTRVIAPGKMVLTGAYAVLRGAPALVVAVTRGAVAHDGAEVPASREVVAALGTALGPPVDASALFDGDRKLGLGASAAALVATLGLRAHARGEDLAAPAVRDAIFSAARLAHAAAQSGGSGIDVAASVYGGVLGYRLDRDGAPRIAARSLPNGVSLRAYASAVSARTTDLRARVDALAARDSVQDARVFGALAEASREADEAVVTGSASGFFAAGRAFFAALSALSEAASAPIVDDVDRALARLAAEGGGTYFPSGAGGGDVAVHLFPNPEAVPSFDAAARALGRVPLDLAIDPRGVRVVATSATSLPAPLAETAVS